jgi:hypothetical protein
VFDIALLMAAIENQRQSDIRPYGRESVSDGKRKRRRVGIVPFA